MENRLKRLKRIMNQKTFSQLTFTEIHRQSIKNKINNQRDKEEIILSIMQLLSVEKTGYQLANLLRGRGIRSFEDNEGALYILLHSLENKSILQSSWISKEEAKYYFLTNKGRKLLQQTVKKQTSSKAFFEQLLEGGTEWKIT
jgi:DNA-binding PadR family transcriptional regulator